MTQVKKFIQSGNADDPANYKLIDVKVGDHVCFKSDVEQSGKIKEIRTSRRFVGNVVEFVLTSTHGFHGEYIGGMKTTVVDADDCWI